MGFFYTPLFFFLHNIEDGWLGCVDPSLPPRCSRVRSELEAPQETVEASIARFEASIRLLDCSIARCRPGWLSVRLINDSTLCLGSHTLELLRSRRIFLDAKAWPG